MSKCLLATWNLVGMSIMTLCTKRCQEAMSEKTKGGNFVLARYHLPEQQQQQKWIIQPPKPAWFSNMKFGRLIYHEVTPKKTKPYHKQICHFVWSNNLQANCVGGAWRWRAVMQIFDMQNGKKKKKLLATKNRRTHWEPCWWPWVAVGRARCELPTGSCCVRPASTPTSCRGGRGRERLPVGSTGNATQGAVLSLGYDNGF